MAVKSFFYGNNDPEQKWPSETHLGRIFTLLKRSDTELILRFPKYSKNSTPEEQWYITNEYDETYKDWVSISDSSGAFGFPYRTQVRCEHRSVVTENKIENRVAYTAGYKFKGKTAVTSIEILPDGNISAVTGGMDSGTIYTREYILKQIK